MNRPFALIRRWHRTAVVIGFLFSAWFAWWLVPPQPRLVIPFSNVPRLVGFSDDGRVLATISSRTREGAEVEGPVHLWDVITGKLKATIGGTDRIAGAQLSPDGKVVAIKRELDPSVYCYLFFDAETGQEKSSEQLSRAPLSQIPSVGLSTPPLPSDWWTACTFSTDSRKAAIVANANGKRSLRLWNIAQGRSTWTATETDWPIAFSPDGRRIAFANESEMLVTDYTMKVLDSATGRIVAKFTGPMGRARTPAFSMDSKLLAAECLWARATRPYEVKIWNLDTRQEIVTLEDEREPVFLPDGNTLVTSNWKVRKFGESAVFWRTITFWDVGQWKKRLSIEIRDSISSPMIAQTGKFIAVRFTESIPPKAWLEDIANDFGFGQWTAGFRIEGMEILDVATGETLATIRQPHGGAMLLAPDGKTIAVEAFDGPTAKKGSVLLWDVPPRKSIAAVLPLWTLLALGFVVWMLRRKILDRLPRVRDYRTLEARRVSEGSVP